ncbi:MAG TPA: hypothetical protein VGC08_16560, partial [Pedobacter sp.]
DEQILERWQTEFDYRLIHIDSGKRFPIPPYEEIKKVIYTEQEKQRIIYNRGRMLSGKPADLKVKLEALASNYGVNEIVLSTAAEREEDKLNSFTLIAKAFNIKA